ncbi:MAG TPA: isocitrate lyase/PEP mutase family protein [Acidobacteriaceae bacterium]|nr:isocitrate lyase/PEP mutase family protein [Terriglobia bacterium]HVC90109.1 isocitrate lyase/PEP mutase family protein [Acidobacteriaceae bacterium]
MNSARPLRQLLLNDEFIVAPGAFDCLSAKAVELAGFSAIYMTGMGTSASRLGLPDYGLATMSEMVANGSAMAATVKIPVIADADTGYGNELNMARTVHEYERHGAAGIHIEDQIFPKKCGHLDKKQVIPRNEFVSKIRAAVSARQDPDFIIIARTDCNAVMGFEEAIARANAALAVGADLALVEAPESMEQIEQIPQRVQGPCVLNMLLGGKSPLLSLIDVESLGYRVVLLSDVLLSAAIAAYDSALSTVRTSRDPLHFPNTLAVKDIFQRLGAAKWDKLRAEQEEDVVV